MTLISVPDLDASASMFCPKKLPTKEKKSQEKYPSFRQTLLPQPPLFVAIDTTLARFVFQIPYTTWEKLTTTAKKASFLTKQMKKLAALKTKGKEADMDANKESEAH